jgi:hypothetical protein
VANVIAVFGILVLCALCYPAWLALIWHTLPGAARAARCLQHKPARCIAAGGITLGALALPLLMLFSAGSGVAQALGWLCIFVTLACSSVGAAGLAAELGQRARPDAARVRVLTGAALLEGAALLPIFGWVLVLPVTLMASLGATLLALRPSPGAVPKPVTA